MVNFENGKTPINDTNLNKAQQDLKGTVLYSNTTGTTGNVTLSDSVANYEYIEIQCRRTDFAYSSGKISQPNGKTVSLSAIYTTSTEMYMYSKIINVNENKINVVRANLVYTNNSTISGVTTDDSNYITEVIGYK